ncbi:MAG: hypothetical protein ACYCO9_11180 [Streptosporangiaceae bacterium]
MTTKNTSQATREPRTASAKAATAKAATAKAATAKVTAKGSARNAADGRGAVAGLVDDAGRLTAEWGPTIGRVALGLVLAWFGYHELLTPQLWTGYVPLISSTSTFAIVLVLVHGWLLLLLAVAIVAGVLLRLSAAISAVLLAEIIISLTISGGLTDISLRDVGVFGLAAMLTAGAPQRLALRN